MVEPEFGRVGQDIPSDAPPMLDNGTSTARAGRSNKSAATAGLFLHLVFIGLIGAATHTPMRMPRQFDKSGFSEGCADV
jgi:hypothetical protein